MSEHAVTVLLVDDQVMIAEAVRRMLAVDDVRFFHCEDPAEAIRMADQVKPTVILQDLVMPGVDGLTLVRYFRAHPTTRDIPMIVLSTKEEPDIKAQAFAVGANDYIVKLPDQLEMLARVRYHSRGYISLLERNEAHAALVESQRQLEVRNRFIRDAFGRYLSDEVVESLLETPEGLRLGGEKRRVTILMADLRGFTPLAERLKPEQVVSLLNRYLGAMTDVIVRHGGTIDEFIGDAILVIFGAPILRPDDARRAVECALAMQQAMRAVNEGNRAEGLPEIAMGVGLHTGEVVVGNIGSQKRAKYGVVGATVNVASRIESFTTGGQTLISEETLEDAGPHVRIEDQLEVHPKGVAAPIRIFAVAAPEAEADDGDPLVRLPVPLEVTCTVVEDKDAAGAALRGRIVALSRRALLVELPVALPPFGTLKLSLGSPAESFYGRTRRPPGEATGLLVVLTAVPDVVAGRLAAALEAAAPGPDL